jgi:hypothetical protein
MNKKEAWTLGVAMIAGSMLSTFAFWKFLRATEPPEPIREKRDPSYFVSYQYRYGNDLLTGSLCFGADATNRTEVDDYFQASKTVKLVTGSTNIAITAFTPLTKREEP